MNLTALGDLRATVILALAFIALMQGNDGNSLPYILLVQGSLIWLVLSSMGRLRKRDDDR
jgi:hypothetical protein